MLVACRIWGLDVCTLLPHLLRRDGFSMANLPHPVTEEAMLQTLGECHRITPALELKEDTPFGGPDLLRNW